MKKSSEQIAKYIIKMVKSVNKDKKYALNILVWYSWTDKQTMEIENYIKENF
jgi:hypothetical protein